MKLYKKILIQIFVFLFLQLFSKPSLGGISIVDFSKYFHKIQTVDATSLKLYAGRTARACAKVDLSTPCNSCANLTTDINTDFNPMCNEHEIDPDLVFTLILKTDNTSITSASTVGIIAKNSRKTTGFTVTGTMGVNQNITISIPWKSLCEYVESSNCSTSFNETFLIGFDKDPNAVSASLTESVKINIIYRYVGVTSNQTWCAAEGVLPSAYEGACDFYVYPGDEKIYFNVSVNVTNELAVGNLTQSVTDEKDASSMKYSHLRVYYFPGNSYLGLVPALTPYTDLEMTTTGLTPESVGGLANGYQYVFVTANVDEGGNITYFSPLNLDLQDGCQVALPNGTRGCGTTQSATPEKVLGLLESKSCFIATAAFGSSLAPQVEILRNFRDRYLLTHSLGRWFVREYYHWSPPVADFIVQHDSLRAVVRAFLWPVVYLVQWLMSSDLLNFCFIIGPFLVLFILFLIHITPILRKPLKLLYRNTLKWNSFLKVFWIIKFSLKILIINKISKTFKVKNIFILSILFSSYYSQSSLGAGPSTETSNLSPKGGSYEVDHPDSEKGLYLIDKNKIYHYKTEIKPKSKSGMLRVFQIDPPLIKGNNGVTYKDMYGKNNIIGFIYDFEWKPFQGFGALGLELGLGFAAVSGTGTLSSSKMDAKERFTMIMIPLDLFLVYRLEYFSNQWLVPYIVGGGTYFGLAEKRDDNKPPLYAGSISAGGGGGFHISISRWDKKVFFTINREYGISDLWLTVDLRVLKSFKDDMDFTNAIASAGLTFDY